MKTIKCAKSIITALILVFCGITTSLLASTVNLGTLTPFTGGDAGEGIDLEGNIIYAFNLAPVGTGTQTVQGVTFVPASRGAPPAGITTTALSEHNYGTVAEYGATANDNALESMMSTVWYGANWTFDLATVPGTEYKLQLILQEGYSSNQGTANRNFDISVETVAPSTLTLAVDELVLGRETNGATQPGADYGLVYTYTFTATDSSFRVALVDSVGGDVNATLNAVTLEELSTTTAPVVALVGNSIYADAPVGTQVGVLSIVNTNSAGFAYSLQPGGDTTHFAIPAGTSNLLVNAPLSNGTYIIAVLATNATSGVWANNIFTIKAFGRFFDFSTNPGIASDWTKYAYHIGDYLTPTWNAVDGDLDLVKTGGNAASGLYLTYVTRAAGESVSMTVKALNWVSGTSYGFVGLMISAVPKPNYIYAVDNTYTLRMAPTGSGATTFTFKVARTYADGTSTDFILYTSPSPIEFSGPYVLEIKRVGDHYKFLVNGSTLYTTTGIAPDFYTPADKDAMSYYEIVIGCDGTMTATVDDFGVRYRPPEGTVILIY